jgi:hypothetical protein
LIVFCILHTNFDQEALNRVLFNKYHTRTQGRIKVLGGPWQSVRGAPQKSMMSKMTYYRHRKFDDAGKKFTKKLNFGAAGRFSRIEAPQAIFFSILAREAKLFIITTPQLQILE